MMFLENEFDVRIDDIVVENWKTAGDIYGYFEREGF
jgi:acyl carrier protein